VARRLYRHGKLSDTDYIGENHFPFANGGIAEGRIFNLESVNLGTGKSGM